MPGLKQGGVRNGN